VTGTTARPTASARHRRPDHQHHCPSHCQRPGSSRRRPDHLHHCPSQRRPGSSRDVGPATADPRAERAAPQDRR